MAKKNKRILKVGKYTLNESLSSELYYQIERWQREIFGKEITFEQCQDFLDEFHFTIDWTYLNDKKYNINETVFFVTALDAELLSEEEKGLRFHGFYLGVIVNSESWENDFCLKYITEAEIRRN